MSQLLKTGSLAMAIVALFALPVLAQYANLDYVGFAYETGGFPPAEVGDELVMLAITDFASDIFEVDLTVNELTFYAHGFIVESVEEVGGGTQMITYTGGTVEVWRDDQLNADWGVSPPNATAPDTFGDGVLFFLGGSETFVVYIEPSGTGSYEGQLSCLGGEALGGPCGDCAYTWGGAFDLNSGAQIPEGYDFQIDGQLNIDSTVPTETSSFGSVKALYR